MSKIDRSVMPWGRVLSISDFRVLLYTHGVVFTISLGGGCYDSLVCTIC